MADSAGSDAELDSSQQDSHDLEESLIVRSEHSYSRGAPLQNLPSLQSSKTYRLLYAVSVAGSRKPILNTLPRAVAVLSNSKRLFLGHLNVMFRCLDPGKAELCYVDTDSCIWSLSEARLEECIRADRRELWLQANILADESAKESCHGLMKLEGSYSAGHFRNLKMYRLYNSIDQGETVTRCKGISQGAGARLPEQCFDSLITARTVIHRSALRPSRAGEIMLKHESKSLAMPFNFKRLVRKGGVHTDRFRTDDPDSASPSSSSSSSSDCEGGEEEEEEEEEEGLQTQQRPSSSSIF